MTSRVIFRGKQGGKTLPACGDLGDVQSGDTLTFFEDGQYRTRTIGEVHKGYVTTVAFVSPRGKIDHIRKVKFEAFYEVLRPESPDTELLDFLEGK